MPKFYQKAKQGIFEELDNGIIKITLWNNYYSEYDHSMESLEIIKQLYDRQQKKVCILGDIRGIKGASKKSRASVTQNGELAPHKHIQALALVIGSPVAKMIGNFILKFNKPSFPFRLFTKEEDAIQFLMTH
ncbi:MAG: hypothetical protein MK212_08615 [Saprospiraceae bacterium]|nr:hypothetical protein [Saprospiraceae bacterium]